MSDTPALKSWAPGLLALGALLFSCDGSLLSGAASTALARAPDDTAQLLPGTWLRETVTNGVKARRMLTLGPDGAFRETVRVRDDAGAVTDFVHEGTWLYDGTNLKRRYTLMNGKPPSRLNLPFATFQVKFESRNEFVGVDHIRGNRIHYQRVPAETVL